MYKWLKSSPVSSEIEDSSIVKKQYKYWRMRIFSGIYIGYLFYYFTRKSVTFAMPVLIDEMEFQITDIGILGSILSISYGASKFLSGILSDRCNPRFFMAIGLILTGIFNLCFGLSSSILWFAIFWGLNGWFQGWGWPPCAYLLTQWYSQNERGRWWGMWNTSQSLGGALIPFIVVFCIQYGGWRAAMFIPGIICICVGFFIMYCLRDTPQAMGLPTIEKFRNDNALIKNSDEKTLSAKEIVLNYVFRNKYVWVLAISYFFVYVIRQAINDFGAFFLMNAKGYSMIAANASIFWFEMGGICGSLAAGWSSDIIFRGLRGPVNILFSLAAAVATMSLYYAPAGMMLLDYILMFLIGFFIFGPQLLIGIAAAEVSHKKAAGAATGFAGCWAYLGAACAGYPIAKITEIFGWYGFFITLACSGALAGSLLLPIWKIKTHPEYSPAKSN